jgi:hypothetical protein
MRATAEEEPWSSPIFSSLLKKKKTTSGKKTDKKREWKLQDSPKNDSRYP